MKTQLSSERRRTCSHNGHGEKEATHVRTVRGKVPGSKSRTYIAFYPECTECAARTIPARFGVTMTLKAIR